DEYRRFTTKKHTPRAARMGHASLMRPEGPLPDVSFVECRYAVVRTEPRRSWRRDWPGCVMSSPLGFHRANAISGERNKRLSLDQRCQSPLGCGVATIRNKCLRLATN